MKIFSFSILLLWLVLSICNKLPAQVLVQTIRGHITDKESQFPLSGATIQLLTDTSNKTGTAANEEGNFRLENVPVGRQKLKVSYLGYKDLILTDLIVSSAKELVLEIGMEISVEALQEISVTSTDKAGTVNEMALVGGRTFSVNETERYPGSRNDPARMASNFAGVQGTNDSRNDIVIRGNSPLGVLWRLNDINIPNPSHFAIAGSTGGPVSILNNKWLAASDFMTAAFPAEYGNSVAGVFDVRMRNGNNEKHEITGQFGLLGTEFLIEGPISKNSKSSYLVNYRYATLAMFGALGIRIGTSAVPKYQDGAFKLNFPIRNAGIVSVFGVGGISNIDIVLSNKKVLSNEIYGEKDRDQYFQTNMGVVGISHAYSINANTFSKLTVALTGQAVKAYHEWFKKNTAFEVIATRPQLKYNFYESKLSFIYSINKRIGARHTVKAGIYLDKVMYNFMDSVYTSSDTINNVAYHHFRIRLNTTASAYLIQPYIQWKYNITEKLSLAAGLHLQYFTLNSNSNSIEPRFNFKYLLPHKQSIGMGYGLHSQLQPSYIYFTLKTLPSGTVAEYNRNLSFTKSHHFVISYDKSVSSTSRIKIETYYQHLFHIPVTYVASSFSLINQGSGFTRFFPDSLTNSGTGDNYGIEATLEKFFSKHYYFMLTTSLFNSTYIGSDKVRRNTDFNGRFATNFLAGTEYNIGEKKRVVLFDGIKITWAGGRRYGKVDTLKSYTEQEIVFEDKDKNNLQFRNYFRFDIRLGFKRNNKRVAHEFAIDLVNVLNTKNILGLTYAPDPAHPAKEPFIIEYQLGRLPIFYYKLDF